MLCDGIAVAQPSRLDLEDRYGDRWASVDGMQKGGAVECERDGLAHRLGAGRARLPIQQRHLAEKIAVAKNRHSQFLAGFAAAIDPHLPAHDYIERAALAALVKNCLATCECLRADALGKNRDLIVG